MMRYLSYRIIERADSRMEVRIGMCNRILYVPRRIYTYTIS